MMHGIPVSEERCSRVGGPAARTHAAVERHSVGVLAQLQVEIG